MNTNSENRQHKMTSLLALGLLVTGVALFPPVASRAQRVRESTISLTRVETRPAAGGQVVTLSADGPLNRTQTWQDAEGFHVTVPNSRAASLRGSHRGVQVRDLGKSLEVVVALKPGSSVIVQPRFNRLDLVVNGNVAEAADEPAKPQATRASAPADSPRNVQFTPASRDTERRRAEETARRNSAVAEDSLRSKPAVDASAAQAAPIEPAKPAASLQSVKPETRAAEPIATGNSPAAAAPAGDVGRQASTTPPGSIVPAVRAPEPTPNSTLWALSSYAGVGAVIGTLVLVLSIVRRRRKTEPAEVAEAQPRENEVTEKSLELVPQEIERSGDDRRKSGGRRTGDKARSEAQGAANNQAVAVPGAPAAAVLYGAYRMDQEVGKLVLGQTHRLDVLGSRAPDDRRAMETSLFKALKAPDTDEAGRRRARQALEEYGFVARHSATLLLSRDAYERASAAQTLGEIRSAASLPFLLEALYDAEPSVRTQAVISIGEVGLPRAIGALLDVARRHPEIPGQLLSRALSACSLEACEVAAGASREVELLGDGGVNHAYGRFTGEITHLDASATFEELPEWREDKAMVDALHGLESPETERRVAAVQALAQFQVQRSVDALAMLAANDPESTVRGAAVTSLAAIDHESVFAPIMIAFADEAREVRAAAARALSRLNFDRADAYVRVYEAADADTLRQVANACIKAGMASQAIDRLVSDDRRQAYEAFSLLSLLAKSGETAPLVEAIEGHKDAHIQLAAARLLSVVAEPASATQLRRLVVRDNVPQRVRDALLEGLHRIEQARPVNG